MPIYPKQSVTVTNTVSTPVANQDTPFDVTLAAADTAEDLVTVPATKVGRAISLVNEGPGDVAIKFDAAATATDTLIREGEAYAENSLAVATKVSFINVTPASTPRVRGQLLSGTP